MPNVHPTPHTSSDEPKSRIARAEQPESTIEVTTSSNDAAPSTDAAVETAIASPSAPNAKTREGKDQRDEAEAIHSLDVTVTRMMPQPIPLWEPAPLDSAEEEVQPAKSRIPTVALMCAVAIVSFVAGGITARLSAQMPLVFPQKAEQQTESTASYVEEPVQQAPVVQQEQEPAPVPEPQVQEPTNEPSYDTDYNTESPTYTTDEPDSSPSEPTTTHRWDLDDQGDSSISYDEDTGRVTFDYDDYSLTVDLEDLLTSNDGKDNGWSYGAPEQYTNDNYNDTYPTKPQERDTYDNGYYGWGTRWYGGSLKS